MYCKHDRLAASCEDCQFIAAFDAGQPGAMRAAVGVKGKPDRAPVNALPESEPDIVEQDTHVMRPDLDKELDTKGSYTLVRAGDAVPADLVDFPRQSGSYAGPAPAKAAAGKARMPGIA